MDVRNRARYIANGLNADGSSRARLCRLSSAWLVFIHAGGLHVSARICSRRLRAIASRSAGTMYGRSWAIEK